nr:MAG TPA: hypothetical protein [Crassvirales sp.]
MKIKNLSKVWVYTPKPTKKDGETTIKWEYKRDYMLNVQQDINELDSNKAGLIDYDRIKVRIDYPIDISKNDGISLEELPVEGRYTTIPPKYRVISNPKIGKSTTFTCDIYHGE